MRGNPRCGAIPAATRTPMAYFLFVLFAVPLIAMTALPVSRLRHWWVRGCDFPRLQIALGLAVALLWYAAWSRAGDAPSPLWGGALLASLAWQIRWIWPYSEMHAQEVHTATPEEVRDDPSLRVITSNVLMDNRDASRLIAHVEREAPDVLVTLESDAWWQEQLDALEAYPHRIACPLDNRYGMHLYSRLPLHAPTVDYLVESDVPSIGTFVELTNGTRVRLHVVHPSPPSPTENPRSTERDVELLMLARRLESCTDPTVVTGDLNDVAWSASTRLFRQRSGLLDPRVGRGMFNTFHAWHWYLRWPLDHTFVSAHFRLREVRRLTPIGSDHFPVLFDLALGAVRALDSHPDEKDIDTELEQETLDTRVAQQATQPTLSVSLAPA